MQAHERDFADILAWLRSMAYGYSLHFTFRQMGLAPYYEVTLVQLPTGFTGWVSLRLPTSCDILSTEIYNRAKMRHKPWVLRWELNMIDWHWDKTLTLTNK